MRKSFIYSALLTGLIVVGAPNAAIAGPATDALSVCITDNTSGRDRKDLVRWVFSALSVHPEIKSMTSIPQEQRDQLDKAAATLFERLLTENCREQAKAAVKADGHLGIKQAFNNLGQIASQELMTDPTVQAAAAQFGKLLNEQKIEAALK